MIEKGVLHLDQNEFGGGERREKEKRNKEDRTKRKKKKGKMGGKEVRLLLVSSVRTTRGSKGQEVS